MSLTVAPKTTLTLCAALCAMTTQAEDKLIIDGVTGARLNNVRAFLSLAKEPCEAPAWRIRHLYRDAPEKIRTALKALGYYQPTLDSELHFLENCWQAHFVIDPGLPVRIGNLDVQILGEAASDPAFTKLIQQPLLKQGAILHHGRYEQLKAALQTLASSRGYLDARFTQQQLNIEPERLRASVRLHFDSGSRYRFGSIQIDQDILNPELVQRMITLQSGTAYASTQLATLYNKLAALPYFQSIDLQPDFAHQQDGVIPLSIKLSAKPRHHYRTGIGFDTNFGPILSGGYDNRRLNRRGHTASIKADLSPRLASLEANYKIPLAKPLTDSLNFGLGIKHEDPDTFTSNLVKLSANRQRLLASGWQEILFTDWTLENFSSGTEKRTVSLLVPGARWQKSTSNSTVRATEGYQINLSLAGAAAPVLSSVSFIQGQALAKWIQPAYGGRLITRAELGATLTNNFAKLPTSYRFFAGGTQSMRGFDYKELGTKDDQGDVIGGKLLSVVSAEYEYFISDNWGVAGFYDFGNAYDPDRISFKSGLGLGVRWLSPVGPVSLDVGVPLNDDADSTFRVHFSAGALL
ncbi:MAG: autotransporter assembly complex family protein [Methylococcales bacterium]|nr:autotransporter assembly complex family protein [Methylococcales bacterium]